MGSAIIQVEKGARTLMAAPKTRLRRWAEQSRWLAASLIAVGLLLILYRAVFVYVLMPQPAGQVQVQAIVTNREQRGTFQEPAFSITLGYVVEESGDEIRSGQRVSFEDYQALAVGDAVMIAYDSRDPYRWELLGDPTQVSLRDLAPGILIALAGVFVLASPAVLRHASREEDFEHAAENSL